MTAEPPSPVVAATLEAPLPAAARERERAGPPC
jgi:hypothetical protein